ncbi:MAG: Lrp/AsnC ligand binding domain-containing protein [Candidatus Thorarchaeota archaeon]
MIAIVLINTEAGSAFSACTEIDNINGVERVHVVTGPYDLVAVIDSPVISLRILIASMHEIKGVLRTETCIAVS